MSNEKQLLIPIGIQNKKRTNEELKEYNDEKSNKKLKLINDEIKKPLNFSFNEIIKLNDKQKEYMKKDPEIKDLGINNNFNNLEKKENKYWYYTIDELIDEVHKVKIYLINQIFGEDGYCIEHGEPIMQYNKFISEKNQFLVCYSVHTRVYFNDGTHYESNGIHNMQQGGNLGLYFLKFRKFN